MKYNILVLGLIFTITVVFDDSMLGIRHKVLSEVRKQ